MCLSFLRQTMNRCRPIAKGLEDGWDMYYFAARISQSRWYVGSVGEAAGRVSGEIKTSWWRTAALQSHDRAGQGIPN
jgi:hypothetical protein